MLQLKKKKNPQDISASEQRFTTNTAQVLHRWGAVSGTGAQVLRLKEPSRSWTCLVVTAKWKVLEGCPCSSWQWTHVFSAYHPMATAVVPSTQDCGSSVFLLGLEREGINCADDCHTLVEATLNFLFTHYVKFGNTSVNGSKYTHWELLRLNLFLVLICWGSGTVWRHPHFKFLFSSHFLNVSSAHSQTFDLGRRYIV